MPSSTEMGKWLVTIHRVDADGGGWNDKWTVEAEDAHVAMNNALQMSLDRVTEDGTHLVSIFVGTPRPAK